MRARVVRDPRHQLQAFGVGLVPDDPDAVARRRHVGVRRAVMGDGQQAAGRLPRLQLPVPEGRLAVLGGKPDRVAGSVGGDGQAGPWWGHASTRHPVKVARAGSRATVPSRISA